MTDPLLNALRKKYEGEIAIAKANINVYTTNPVWIGDHSNLVADVDSEMESLANFTYRFRTLNTLINIRQGKILDDK